MADIKTVQLIVNSEQAKSKIAALNKQLDVAKQKKLDAFRMGDAKGIEVNSKEIQKLERQLTKAQTRGETITKTLKGLDQATPNELKRTIRELTKELNSGKIERGTKEWEVLNDALRECNGELKKIKEESKAAEGLTKKIRINVPLFLRRLLSKTSSYRNFPSKYLVFLSKYQRNGSFLFLLSC